MSTSTIDIASYVPADKSATCKRCNSKVVTWHDAKPEAATGTPGKWVLCEIFELGGEEVYSVADPHRHYCGRSIEHTLQQGKINEAEIEWLKDDEPDKPKLDGHPYFCGVCGGGVMETLDGVVLNFDDGQPGILHNCNTGTRDARETARARGTRTAKRVKFAEISHRMELAKVLMDAAKASGAEFSDEHEAASSEWFMLRKRLYTEIPD